MRILFAQLCKLYIFILVAIATVTLGLPTVPTENVITTLIQDTQPTCPQSHPVYSASLCSTSTVMLVFCEDASGQNTATILQNCDPGNICIEHYSQRNGLPHATCVVPRNYRKWDNFNNPGAGACSAFVSYVVTKSDVMFGITAYASDNNPIQVYWLDAFVNKGGITPEFNSHNYSEIAPNYNGENVQYCFNGGSNAKVTAYAACWVLKAQASDSSNFNITSVPIRDN